MLPYQAILVTIIVLAAGVYVVRELWRSVTTKSGGSCGSCGSCGGKDSPPDKTKQLVSLDDESAGKK